MILRTETSVLFIIPWGRHWLIGTIEYVYQARAIAYRQAAGIQGGVSLAVVVQEMVPSQSSGVLFTANPLTGKRSEHGLQHSALKLLGQSTAKLLGRHAPLEGRVPAEPLQQLHQFLFG